MKKLYSYQKRVHTLVLNALTVIGRALMVMAPGLGKTVVSAFLLRSIHKEKEKVLFLCHDNYILAQAHNEFKETFDPQNKLIFHNFFGATKDIEEAKQADVVFGSFQSLNNDVSRWYQFFKKKHFDYIIIDEGHHSQAPTFKEVVTYFKPKKVLCMTGTPDRMDESDIRDLFGDEVVNITIEEGIAKGWLTDVEYHVLSDGLDKEVLKQLFQDVVDEKQRISLNQVNKRLFVKKRDEQQIKLIKKHTKNWTKKCIIFCASIHHVRTFSRHFAKGTFCTFHSENTTKTNDKNLEAFKNGNVNVILTVNKFNEGIDIPSAEVIVFNRLTESGIVFRQQLGRGLRKMPGKSKVIVLDFVANIRRILMIQGMLKAIKRYAGPVKGDKSLLAVSGNHYSFDFTDELEDLTEILRVARMGFYETWQEASEVAIELGAETRDDYRKIYKEDRQLTSQPDRFYENFPGWEIFLGKERKDINPRRYKEEIYSTWRQASKAAKRLKIISRSDYKSKYIKDKMLPSTPDRFYENFPGWPTFLGNLGNGVRDKDKFYSTWQQAARIAKKLGITSGKQYRQKKLYLKDPKLPSYPPRHYSNFPGWNKFFAKQEDANFYSTWRQASKVSIALGIESGKKYRYEYIKDKRLPSTPARTYKNFPGWDRFLGKK